MSSGDGSVTRLWGDGEHKFRLRIGELRELENKRNSGAFEIYQRLAAGSWRIDDVREVLRLGLIGGGMAAPLALGLVAKYAKETTFLMNVVVAREVIMAGLFGDPDDVVGKLLAETGAATSEDGPDSRPSSEPEPQWDGQSTTSTDAASGSSPPLSMDGRAATAATIQNGRLP